MKGEEKKMNDEENGEKGKEKEKIYEVMDEKMHPNNRKTVNRDKVKRRRTTHRREGRVKTVE